MKEILERLKERLDWDFETVILSRDDAKRLIEFLELWDAEQT